MIGRSASTVSWELRRNADGLGRYRASTAHALAYGWASRRKPAKLVTNQRLRDIVEADLAKKYSPEQITGRLKRSYPDRPEMQGVPKPSTSPSTSSPEAPSNAT